MRKAMLVAALLGGPAWAGAPAPRPMAVCVAQADLVVVGKVVAVEEKDVSARAPGTDRKVGYRLAVVKVEEALLGAKGQTHVRVGFLPDGPRAPVAVKVGDEALFFLTQHPDEPFAVAFRYADVVRKGGDAAGFARVLDEARRVARALAAPEAALKSKDAEERLQAAMLVLYAARTRLAFRVGGAVKQEPLDADLSRLTLGALAAADWGADRRGGFEAAPRNLFAVLGLGEADGWRAPPDLAAADAAAQKWLRDNAATYRIQKVVVGK